ncbi:predicted protein [Thalassiosira pseudonana CCMP1335]|uniref:Uncharacterized protein n=1 Tax=Thalassiosira pseudonana TaxID=35128 RepID=B5YM48_THAPS|nr:predicted protein [Thalassiosira pseudonana CCMP1335]ACI64351.1 predicted protein [Thalassiosira pseudonana CCMP1335]
MGTPMGESTPLLGTSSHHTDNDEESAVLQSSSSAAPQAPPPVGAPPPPPPSSSTTTSKLKIFSSSSNNNSEADDTSQSQLSTSQKSKSSRRSKRSKRGGTSSSGGDPAVEAATAAATNIKRTIKQTIQKQFVGPRKSMCHLMFDGLRYLGILASCMMLVVQVVPLVIFILLELRLPFLQRFFTGLNWILRGFLYTFIGLIGEWTFSFARPGMEQDLAIKVEGIASGSSSILGPDYMTMFASLFMSLTTCLMISVGTIYMVLGALCMQGWYERLEREHKEKVVEWKRKRKVEKDFKKQKEDYKEYENDRREGRGEWYDDIAEA